MDDIDAIARLKYRYLRTLDTKEWTAFADCFVPEATADYAGLVFGSREELVGYMRTNLGEGMVTMHHVHHPEITVDGDTAVGVWYLEDKVYAVPYRVVIEGAAIYEDRYVRTADGWRVQHTGYQRTFELTWSMDDVPSFKIDTSPRPHAR
ncbi:nuclear transport factor 2 family protein [Nocardioides speluncae]|uniref:nuclear transport factor 2 family protein n=1 Tax=Nocardioides speluncae TaxID=2670337 RepID=UPI000D6882AA|nr:nuclear transport factor 2 family protein [Nocardioides speluncae]